MIPLSDKNPTRSLPWVNWTLIAINLGVFFYELSLPSRQLDRLIFTWGTVPNNILSALSHPLQTPLNIWFTLISSQFLHAGWLHVLGNMLYLWIFGDNIEDVLGHFTYLVFYLFCGAVAGIAQSFVLGPSHVPSIGASGAIAGVLGAYLVLYPWARIRVLIPIIIIPWIIDIPALLVLGWWFIQQFFYGATVLTSTASEGIAFWAHIGGFVVGAILILPFISRAYRRRTSMYIGFDEQL